MGKPLRLLIVEDSEDDALLLLRELRRGGYDPESERVETAEAMQESLDRGGWDLVISDYVMPKFGGLQALALVRKNGLDLPFLIVSGNIGEDTAVNAMKAGAHDYILKGNLTRLTPAVERELGEAVMRRQRQQMEGALQEQSRTLNAFFRHTYTPLVFLDKDFNFIRVNEAYAKACGRSVSDFPGKNHFALYPSDELREQFLQVVATRQPYRAYSRPFVFPDHPEWGVSYLDLALDPVLSSAGEVDFLVFSLQDVTARRRAEEDRIRLASAVEATADAVVITDAKGYIQYVNPAFEQITGYGRDEALGRTLHLLDSNRNEGDVFAEMRDLIRREGAWRGLLLHRKKDGTLYHEDCTYSPVKDAAGEVINYVSVKRDVTEKLRLEAIAEAVNTMDNIGYVFSGVRHEIGNPVNTINMIVGILQSKLDGLTPDAIRGYLDRVMTQVGRVEYLLKSLKSFNLYEVPDLQLLSVPSFLESFLPLVQPDFTKRGVDLAVEAAPDATTVYADPRALQQVLLNLLTNALDALSGRDRPRIVLRIVREGGMTGIRVEDNGAGIPPDKLSDLFKPFFTTKAQGTGLGLVLVKKMITRMNGTIEVESTVDAGTKVHITLPEGAL